MNRKTRRAILQANAALIASFKNADHPPQLEANPTALCSVLLEVIDGFESIRSTSRPIVDQLQDDINELSIASLECLTDLHYWAYQLSCNELCLFYESCALEFSYWITKHHGQITEYELLANSIAHLDQDHTDITEYSRTLRNIFSILKKSIPENLELIDNSQTAAWITLHINYAIVAIRSHDMILIKDACTILESRIATECNNFYHEAIEMTCIKKYPLSIIEFLRKRQDHWKTQTH